MTIKQLKIELSKLPDTMDVFLKKENGDFDYAPLEIVEIKRIRFSEGGEDGPFAMSDVLVLDIE